MVLPSLQDHCSISAFNGETDGDISGKPAAIVKIFGKL